MWQKALENAKLIISTILTLAALMMGTWTLATNTFVTRAEADEQMAKFSAEIAYNKAFRLETKIDRILVLKKTRDLSETEIKELKRLKAHLKQVDEHITQIEIQMFSKHYTD